MIEDDVVENRGGGRPAGRHARRILRLQQALRRG
ncbi:hypothetical protein EES40_07415 [Streptomyces sp. ADI93-02]|nr:hypothetical protein EES40_07415 [Streptomyces sp. ADI93-02]